MFLPPFRKFDPPVVIRQIEQIADDGPSPRTWWQRKASTSEERMDEIQPRNDERDGKEGEGRVKGVHAWRELATG